MGLLDRLSRTFDKHGYDLDGYDKKGYDKNGFNKNGYDKKGYDKNGFNKTMGLTKTVITFSIYGIYIDTKTTFDKDGFNKNGYDEETVMTKKDTTKKDTTKKEITNSIKRKTKYTVIKTNFLSEYIQTKMYILTVSLFAESKEDSRCIKNNFKVLNRFGLSYQIMD